MKIRKNKIWFVGCLIVMQLLVCSLTAFAVDRSCQISIDYKYDDHAIAGAEFRVFKVGEVSAKGNLKLTGDYKKFPVKVDVSQGSELQTAADTLYGYIQKENMEPDYIVCTDETGHASVTELEKGLYLVVNLPYQWEDRVYLTQPQFVVLPWEGQNQVELDVKASMEYVQDRWIELKVLKNWDDDKNSSDRPKSVTIYLLRDGEVYDTVVLSKENNWRFVWEDLYANALWTVVEEPVTDYLVTVEKVENTFLVTNKGQKPPKEEWEDDDDDDDEPAMPTKPGTDPTDPSSETLSPKDPTGGNRPYGETEDGFMLQVLPQTGVVWWPVVLMVFAGMLCIISGTVLCRRSRHE